MGDRQPQVGDAGLEVVLEAGERARQEVGGVGADARRQLPGNRPRRRLVAGGDARLDLRLGKIALQEVLVFGPQPLGDLAHRRPRQKPPARLVGEGVLDVARRQAPRVKFDRQALERLGTPRKRRPHPRDERLGRVANLRRRVFDRPLRRLHLARPIAVAVAGLPALAAFVALAADRVGDVAFERLLDDQPQRQADQIATSLSRPQISVHQGAKLLARALRRG